MDDSYAQKQAVIPEHEVPAAIRTAAHQLRGAYPDGRVTVRRWNENFCALTMEVRVQLPSRGAVGGVDIREVEPIYLLFDLMRYPWRAPWAHSDRRSFPRESLPHLNPTGEGVGAWFCLHRGSIHDWFSEHSIVDFVERIRGWLRDGARGRLIRREDGWEPVIMRRRSTFTVFSPERLERAVRDAWTVRPDAGHRFLWHTLLGSVKDEPLVEGSSSALRLEHVLDTDDDARSVAELGSRYNQLHSDDVPVDRIVVGILLWPPAANVDDQFTTLLPRNLGQLVRWLDVRGYDVAAAIRDYGALGLQVINRVPIILAVRRPQRLIGSTTDIELLSFVVDLGPNGGEALEGLPSDAPVDILGHRAPLTPEFAAALSKRESKSADGTVLVLGAGAMGSKLCLHMVRAGETGLIVVDEGELSPHNLVRHGLGPSALGKGKAEGIKEYLDAMYYRHRPKTSIALKMSVQDFMVVGGLRKVGACRLVLDATASVMVREILVRSELPEDSTLARCEIAHDGNLGILAVEGPGRNPRIDELEIGLYDLADRVQVVSDWLRAASVAREKQIGSRLEDIRIGQSCSSDTMELADDVVSIHAAGVSIALNERERGRLPSSTGLLHLQIRDGVASRTAVFQAPPWTRLLVKNDPSWQVHLAPGIGDSLLQQLQEHRPAETGGIFVGLVHQKRRIIYVTRSLAAPADSERSPLKFLRGVHGLPNEEKAFREATGDLLGYVGEWHTHPRGPGRLSKQDKATVARLRGHLSRVPMPTFVMVVTPRVLHPFVFPAVKRGGRKGVRRPKAD